ncbi:DNA gyrase/topoisomerase IV subunit B [Cellulomonas biazotea]|uniref:DNA gyrase/topoisomerase IV subunit B n=1 Tax=Cellulomonas biazotea TaxID=1709 RepID=UPI00103043F2|nr:DNA topoisomerase IV subunit B [Cellulomonas biazotea]
MTTTSPQSGYTARHLSVLEGLEAVRKRPGMYIGTTDSRGLMHCLWEIIDNSVDEALAGHGDRIDIVLHADTSVEVRDNGRGVPVDVEPKTGLTGVEVVFTKLHAGGKFGGGSYGASGGLHGVGASVVNALSSRLDVEVDRDGRTHRMTFHRGEPGVFDDAAGTSPESPFEPFVSGSELAVVGKVARARTGTRVRYWADRQIFPKTAVFSYDELVTRARQTSFLVPGLTLTVRDERGIPGTPGADGPHEETFFHSGGVVDFVDHLSPDPAVTDTWHLTGEGTFTETVPVLDDRGHMSPQEVSRTCEVDIALRWGTGYETEVRSFVNIIATPKGGTHLAGFETGLLRTLRKAVEANARRLKISAKDAATERIEKEDVLAGMTAVVTVRLAEPQFEGQTKEVLGTGPVRAIVAKVLDTELGGILVSTKREHKAQSALLLDKVVGEMRARLSARKQKEISRRKNALESSSLPAKLADCRIDDVERSELFIVEGDSALGTAKLARSSDFQALLPIRGKILNVQKASVTDMLKNAECASIIQVIGAGSGRTFELEAARYGKIVMMTDADVDGAHIRTLLLTLFFRYMRPLVEAGRVYAAVPPLHRIELVGSGGRKVDPADRYIYTYSEAELAATLKRLDRSGKKYKDDIQRYKGLGEMDADQLAETTMDPRHRTLRRVTMDAAARAEQVFELLMGSDVAPRKDFIVAGAQALDRSRIDA